MKLSAITYALLDSVRSAGHPLMLRSGPGMGKTEHTRDYTVDRDIGFVDIMAPTMDAPDVLGFLIPTKDSAGGPTSYYTKPDWLRRIEATGKSEGVLFIDEFMAADHLVQKAWSPIFSERRIQQWELPDGWVAWLAGNRTIDKAGANRLLGHTANRMCILDVEPDVDGWVHWANSKNIHPMYVAFAQRFPGVVFNQDPPKDANAPRISPRSFVYSHDFHTQNVSGMHLPADEATQQIVAGYIGEGASAQLFGFLKVANELPEIHEILEDPDNCRVPASERLDAQYAAMQMCVHHAAEDTVEPLFRYISRLQRELQTAAVRQMLKVSNGTLLNSPSMGSWLANNRALVNATMAD